MRVKKKIQPAVFQRLPPAVRKSPVFTFSQLQQLASVPSFEEANRYSDLLAAVFQLRDDSVSLLQQVHEQAAKLIDEGCLHEAWALLHAEIKFSGLSLNSNT